MDIEQLCDELKQLQAQRISDGWDNYWRDCMKYTLPADASYERLLQQGDIAASTSVFHQATTTKRTEHLYDQTSLWAIERLTAGLITLKTPESAHWHGLDVDDFFGYEATQEEMAWFDRLVRYLFKVRANPKTTFWPSHKAAVRSMTAMGDGFFFVEELFGDSKTPYRYTFVPLGECYPAVDDGGALMRFYRVRPMTAEQAATKWPGKVSSKVQKWADDPKKRNMSVDIVHAVVPRGDRERHGKPGVFGAPLRSVYFEKEQEHIIDESGYYEFPYIQHSWNRVAGRPFSEGPVALALAEVKSLNELAKNELVAGQQAVNPPLAVYGENMGRINLNAGKVNANLINGDGRLLVQPITTNTRPDFAQAVLEQRRNQVREMLYLNLWQILIERPDMTATEALLRSQEKGELLGPVGISFNHSLASMVEREIGILGRKGAFAEGSPLAVPESLMDKDIMPHFTAPLDRMRNLDEVRGAQMTVQGMMEVAPIKPEIMERLNVDRYAELLRRGNGAPADLFYNEDTVEAKMANQEQLAGLMQTIEAMKGAGDAAQSIGAGAEAMRGPLPDIAQAVAA